MTNTAAVNAEASPLRAISDEEMKQVSGGFPWIPIIVGLGILLYPRDAEGGKPKASAPGDYPTGDKNMA
jgi:hypothetical protein